MAGEFEAAGTAIEGALLGAAVEETNRSAGGTGETRDGTACLNCGAALSGAFCAACGQQAEVHRTLSAIWHDILHSVLHFDGKFWRTLPLLAFRPGELTRRYVHGERVRFVSPMALFLFTIFLMFAVFSFTGGSASDVGGNLQTQMAAESTKFDRDIAKTEASLKAATPNSDEAEMLKKTLAELKSDRNGIAIATTGKPIYNDAGARMKTEGPISISSAKANTGWPWLDEKFDKGGRKMFENPSLAFYKLQSNGYKFAWLLIPLSLPFVWLVTLGVRGHRFYDHAVFTTYSISFMCLLFVAVSLADTAGIGAGLLGIIFLIIPPLHLYKQLRNAYGLSRIGTILRMIPLLTSIVIIMTLFFLILLMLGMMG